MNIGVGEVEIGQRKATGNYVYGVPNVSHRLSLNSIKVG